MFDKYNIILDNMEGTIPNIDNKDLACLQAFIEKHLPPKDMEKKLYGEVFTPLALVKEMLDAVDKYADKDFWKNPKNKILDPAAGIGNFQIVAFHKLMDGLTSAIPNEAERRRHILENMLYMVELNPNNARTMKEVLNGDTYRLNIVCGDFLANDEMRGLWGVEKFDLVMGNPPYNPPNSIGTGNFIWHHFVRLGLDMVNESGFLTFVHPPGWRKPTSSQSKTKGLYNLMTRDNHMVYLEIHDTRDGLKIFDSGTRYDWYVLRKGVGHKTKSVVKDEHGVMHNIDLTKTPWLPNHNFKEVFALIATKGEAKCRNIYSGTAYDPRKQWVKDDSWVKANPKIAKQYKRVIIHTIPKTGPRYMWTNDFTKDVKYDAPMFGIPKVIIGDGGINEPFIDYDGLYGCTQDSFGIATDVKNLKVLAKYLISSKFNTIIHACKWGNFRIDWKLFTYFRDEFWL